MIELCPYCNTKPKLYDVGDNKTLYVYRCPKCNKDIVALYKARHTKIGALIEWNKTTYKVRKIIAKILKLQNSLR